MKLYVLMISGILILLLAACSFLDAPDNTGANSAQAEVPTVNSPTTIVTNVPNEPELITIASSVADVFGDSQQYTVNLVATKRIEFPGFISYEGVSLRIYGNSRDETIALDLSDVICAYPDLYLGDFTGDGISDIFVKIPSVGSDHSPTLCYVYSTINGTLCKVFDYDDFTSTLTYTVTRKDNYTIEFCNSIEVDKKFIFDLSDLYKRNPDYFKFEDIHANSIPMYDVSGRVNPNVPSRVETVNWDVSIYNDITGSTSYVNSTYKILIKQDIWGGASRHDYVGYVLSFLEWNENNKQFTIAEQIIAPLY